MTVHQLAKELYRDLGINSLVPAGSADNTNVRGPSVGDPEAIINSINGAYLEIAAAAPSTILQKSFGAVVRAPQTITIAVTQYSTVCTITGWQGWMEGCTVRISNDDVYNEIAYETALTRPHMGGTGTTTATIWSDCVPFTEECAVGLSAIGTVLTPVRILGYGSLTHCASRDEFLLKSGLIHTVTPHTRPAGTPTSTFNKQSGIPDLYFVDSRNRANAAYTLYLRVNPMPDIARALEWQALIDPPTYDVCDIDTGDHVSDPGIQIHLPAPMLYLRNVARKWISGDARFCNTTGKDEIMRQYKVAMDAMSDLRLDSTAGMAKNHLPTFKK